MSIKHIASSVLYKHLELKARVAGEIQRRLDNAVESQAQLKMLKGEVTYLEEALSRSETKVGDLEHEIGNTIANLSAII